jgi:hypothetical protein
LYSTTGLHKTFSSVRNVWTGIWRRTDPEAPLLKTKRGVYSPAFVSSALADEDRMVVAVCVLPSSEAGAVGPMLDQANRVSGPVKRWCSMGTTATGP